MSHTRIALGSDHGGFEQKEQLKSWLESEGYSVEDSGCFDESSVDYPDFALPVAQAVAAGDADWGILVCGTGIGMMLAASKVHGIRAVNLTSPEFAKLSREHNNANVMTLSGRFVPLDKNKEIVTTFLNTDFEGGRHENRVQKIMSIEQAQ